MLEREGRLKVGFYVSFCLHTTKIIGYKIVVFFYLPLNSVRKELILVMKNIGGTFAPSCTPPFQIMPMFQ